MLAIRQVSASANAQREQHERLVRNPSGSRIRGTGGDRSCVQALGSQVPPCRQLLAKRDGDDAAAERRLCNLGRPTQQAPRKQERQAKTSKSPWESRWAAVLGVLVLLLVAGSEYLREPSNDIPSSTSEPVGTTTPNDSPTPPSIPPQHPTAAPPPSAQTAPLEPNPNTAASAHFTRGSHIDNLVKAPGTPSKIERHSGLEVWTYGRSTVRISMLAQLVVAWSNVGDNLNVRLEPGPN